MQKSVPSCPNEAFSFSLKKKKRVLRRARHSAVFNEEAKQSAVVTEGILRVLNSAVEVGSEAGRLKNVPLGAVEEVKRAMGTLGLLL
jgi:hypothetical protein